VSQYTLLRHSGYAQGGNPDFEDAVEATEITNTEAYKVRAAGGVLFATHIAATAAEIAANYPDGSKTDGAHAPGHFSSLRIHGAEIYVPR
jgi:hypothetical protein